MTTPRDHVLEQLDDIDREACAERLAILGPAGLTNAGRDQALHHLAAMANAGQALRDTVAADLLADRVLLDTNFKGLDRLPHPWMAYGSAAEGGVNGADWGTPGGRVGRYSPKNLTFTADGLVFGMVRRPDGRFDVAYITTDPAYGPGQSFPLFGLFEVWGCFDLVHGFWPCILWGCDTIFGAGSGEWDLSEGATRHALDRIKMTYHDQVTVNGAAQGLQYNLASKYLRRNALVGKGIDFTQVQRHWFECSPLNGGRDMLQRFGIGDQELYRWSTVELRAKGVELTGGLPAGWTLDICTQAGGDLGGPVPADYTSGAQLLVERVRVTDLTPA